MPSRPTRTEGKGPIPDEVLTIKDVAAGELPAFKIRGQGRIRSTEFERWVDEQPRGGGDAVA